MPLSECKRRRRNECPSPARSGATPRFTSVGVAVLGTDATIFPFSSVRMPELFIILTQEKRSQECPRYRIILKPAYYVCSNISTGLIISPVSEH